MTVCLAGLGAEILNTGRPAEKVTLTEQAAIVWSKGNLECGVAVPPDMPARPDHPVLVAPKDVARRTRGRKGRIALLHAVAHIELNAIDLAWDLVVRFSGLNLPKEFYDDGMKVAREEALHFSLLQERLASYDAQYGDFPAHNGLWEAAQDTSDDVLARLAIVPLVLEARGLDITPSMIERFNRDGDRETSEALKRILSDEIGHVRIGQKWFEYIAKSRRLDPTQAFRDIVKQRFRGQLKPPFNHTHRAAAGMPREYYEQVE